jgi:hypothetical protein
MGFVQRGTWIVGLAALAVAACTGSGVGLDANGNPIPPGGGGGGEPLTPDFKSIQDNVFTPICTKCHIGAGAPEGLQLDAAHSYALLVGVPSTEQPNVLRVKAGDPDNSYIVQKLEGAPSISGARMPSTAIDHRCDPYMDYQRRAARQHAGKCCRHAASRRLCSRGDRTRGGRGSG